MRFGYLIYAAGVWGASSPAILFANLHQKFELEARLHYKIAEKNVLVFTATVANALGQLLDPTTVTLRLKTLGRHHVGGECGNVDFAEVDWR